MKSLTKIVLLLIPLTTFAQSSSTKDDKWDHVLTASQIFLGGATGARVTTRSLKSPTDSSVTVSYVGLAGTTIALEKLLIKKKGWKWKMVGVAINVGVGVTLVSITSNDVRQIRGHTVY